MKIGIDAPDRSLKTSRPVRPRLLTLLLALFCFLSLARCHSGGEQVGSETHFLRKCPDNQCAQGDSCVCGVCTVACDSVSACSDRLGKDAVDENGLKLVCRAPQCENQQDQQAAAAAVCDVVCATDQDCKPLGASFVCDLSAQGGSCRTQAPISGSLAQDPCPGNMRLVPAGTLVDTGGASHAITALCLDETEISVANYTVCVTATNCTAPAAGNYFVKGRESHPVNDVTLAQATAFCNSLGGGARLPTSLEWQWAAQGGTGAHTYPWGDTPPSASDAPARVCAFAATPDTCAVGGRAAGADPWGITDLSGNVAELVTTDTMPCVAGGSYAAADPSELSSTSCVPFTAEAVTIGFRCAEDVPPG